jgi:hypothetical protein
MPLKDVRSFWEYLFAFYTIARMIEETKLHAGLYEITVRIVSPKKEMRLQMKYRTLLFSSFVSIASAAGEPLNILKDFCEKNQADT